MEVTVQYQGGVAFDVEARGHHIICDQPKENSGADDGMSPPELLLGALATCAGYYAIQYLTARGLASGKIEVRVKAEKALKPARLAAFKIEITTPFAGERHQEGILRAVKACLIHNTLLNAPSIETVVHASAEAAA